MPDYLVNLQNKIQSSIPLSDAMQFTIVELDSCSILVRAPLQPNVNVHGTVFAGSIYSVAVLAGWALCTHIMELNQMAGDLVVADAKIKYHSPISGDIECQGEVNEVDRDAFCSGYKKLGKSKLKLTINVGRLPNAILQGSYFAVSRS
ncbi:MAG: YiiD C-terminal domain-containing protein [Proteobacteria bacterium]|nr:YiiD C-terminal domain-containing protein [Pseudomonadota bacterium]